MNSWLSTMLSARRGSKRAARAVNDRHTRHPRRRPTWTPEWLEERCLLAGDMTPPEIVDVEALTDARGKKVATVVLTASEDMAEPAAETEANYRTRLPGRDKRLGTADDVSAMPSAADYDPATRRITLTLATPLKLGTMFQVTASAAAGGLADAAGNPLDGDGDGAAGDNFAFTLALGSSLKFTEADGDQVSLKLTGGDVIVLNQGADDAAPRLEILNRAPGTSTLTGSVKRKGAGDGRTIIDGITGDTITNRLPGASFIVNIPDTTPPAAPANLGLTPATDSGSSTTDAITNVTSPTVRGNAESGVVVRLLRDGTEVGQTTSNGTWQIPVGPLADGQHSFTATATDTVGNKSLVSAPLVVTIDTAAPAAPTGVGLTPASDSGSSNSDGITNVASPTVAGDAETGSLVRLFRNGTEIGQTRASSPWQIPAGQLAEGEHTFTATTTDAAGNTSQLSIERVVTVDTLRPTAQTALDGTLNVQFSEFTVLFNEPMADAAFTSGGYSLVVAGGPNDGQTIAIQSVEEVDEQTASIELAQPTANQGYRFTIGPAVTDLAGNPPAGPAALAFSVSEPTHVSEFVPAHTEELVGLTREIIVRFDKPVDPATVTPESFFVIAAGQRVEGTIRVSATERFATLFHPDPLPQSARIRTVVEGDQIMGRDGLPLDADGDGRPGGTGMADYTTHTLTRLPDTDVWGFLFDSNNKNPDGSDLPIVGARLEVEGLPGVFAVTDATGKFVLEDMPAGEFFVKLNGNPAAAPAGFIYGAVKKPFHSVPGQSIQLNMMGVPFNIYLPLMSLSEMQPLVPGQDAVVGFSPTAMADLADLYPDVPAEVWQRLQVTVPADSVFFDDGQAATLVTAFALPPDRIPVPLPPGVNPAIVFSVDAGGAQNFDRSASIVYPNIDGLAPGETRYIWAFDHDAGEWITTGTMTVSSDGLTLVSDADSGVRTLGWRFLAPNPGTTVQPRPRGNPDPDPPKTLAAPPVKVDGQSMLIRTSGIAGAITITNEGKPDVHVPVTVFVTLTGIRDFMSNFQSDEYNFTLVPGGKNDFALMGRAITAEDIAQLQNDKLAGKLLTGSIRIQANAIVTDAQGNRTRVTVRDQTLHYAQLFTLNPSGLAFDPTLDVQPAPGAPPPQTQTLAIAIQGAFPAGASFNGDARIVQTSAPGQVNLTFTPNPQNTTPPTGNLFFSGPNSTALGSVRVNDSELLSLDPIAIRVSVGTIKREVSPDKRSFTFRIDNAKLEIGLKSAVPFQALTTFEGNFYADDKLIQLDGVHTVFVTGPDGTNPVPKVLFRGLLALPRGQAQAPPQPKAGNAADPFTVAGLKVEVTDIAFASGQLQLQGSIALPDEWGGISLEIKNPNKLTISPDGSVGITGGNLTFPDKKFKLLRFDVETKGMQVRYQAGQPAPEPGQPSTLQNLKISGKLSITAKLASDNPFVDREVVLEADLVANPEMPSMDNFIQISATNNINIPYRVSVKGQLSVNAKNLKYGPFGFDKLSLAVDNTDPAAVKWAGSATIVYAGIELTGTIGFLNNKLNQLGLQANKINKPLGTSPFFFQSIGGEFNNLSDLKMPPEFSVTAALTVGPELLTADAVELEVPEWLNMDKKISVTSALRLDGKLTIVTDTLKEGGIADTLKGNLTLTLIDKSIGQGMVNADINWREGILNLTNMSVSLLGGAATLNASGSVHPLTGLFLTGVATVTIPKGIGFFGALSGRPLGSGAGTLSLPNFSVPPLINALTKGTVLVHGTVSNAIPFFSGEMFGARLHLDGVPEFITYLNAKEIAALPPQVPPGARGALPPSATFPVPGATPGLLLSAEWTTPTSENVTLRVTDPNGNVTTLMTGSPAGGGVRLVPELGSDISATVAVDTPIAGNWKIEIANAAGLGEVSFGAIGAADLVPSPTLQIDGPAADVASGVANIDYQFTAPSPDTTIRLFFDPNPSDFTGVEVASFAATDATGTVALNTAELDLPTGSYRVYGVIDDGINPAVFSNYSVGRIAVIDPAALSAVANVRAFWNGGDQELLTWDAVPGADSYRVTATDLDVPDALPEATATNGPDTSIVLANFTLLTPLVAGHSYRFQVQAVSEDAEGLHVGRLGGEVVGVVGPVPGAGPSANLSGRKFVDLDRDGVLDAGEQGLPGVTIRLLDAVTSTVLGTQVTAGDGAYAFGPLTPGRYTIEEVVDPTRPEFFPRQPGKVTSLLTSGANSVHFGNPGQGTIAGTVRHDTNFDGAGDAPLLAEVTVFLDMNGNDTRDADEPTVVADAAGAYTFAGLLAGNHAVAVVPPPGFNVPAPRAVTLTADQDAAGADFILTQVLTGEPPAVVLFDTADILFQEIEHEFDSLAADGPGGAQGVLNLRLANLGGQPLNITAVNFADATAPFSVVGIAPGTTVLPSSVTGGASTISFSIMFDPARSGPFSSMLTITSDDPAGPVSLRLVGQAVSLRPEIKIQVPNNNAGGLGIGSTPTTRPNFGTVTNIGTQPLTITDVRGDQFQVTGLLAGFGQPLVLAPGASQTFSLAAKADQPGLQRGSVQFFSNDPDRPVVTVPVVATGIPDADLMPEIARNFVALSRTDRDAPPHRGRTNGFGGYSFVLPANVPFDVTLFDPSSGLVAHYTDISNGAGTTTFVNDPGFQASAAPDTDGDGLPDDVEFAVGTSPNRADTDNDGIDDFTAVREAIDGFPAGLFPTGVVASLTVGGASRGVVIEAAPGDSRRQTAYVATCPTGAFGSGEVLTGLAIVDVSRFASPVLLTQLDLGCGFEVGVDPVLNIAAVAGGDRLYLVNVADPVAPVLRQTLQSQFPAQDFQRVAVRDGIAYVAPSFGTTLRAIDLLTGDELDHVDFSNITYVDALATAGDELFVLTSNDPNGNLAIYRVADAAFQPLGSVPVPGFLAPAQGARALFVGGGLAYVGQNSGYVVIDVSHPTAPVVIGRPPATQLHAIDLAHNGSGLLLTASSEGTLGTEALSIYDISDPTDVTRFLTSFPTPLEALSLAIASGVAYASTLPIEPTGCSTCFGTVASSFLAINYLPLDDLGQPPTVTTRLLSPDVDLVAPGIQMLEGSTVSIDATVADDVQVQSVELLIDGRVVRRDVSFPFDLTGRLPRMAAGASSVALQVRATDTGGNAALSEPVRVELVGDVVPPRIVRSEPAAGATALDTLRSVRLVFSEPLDPATVTPANFRLLDRGGTPVPLSFLALQQNDRAVRLAFDQQLLGEYRVVIRAAAVTDRAGNALGQADVDIPFTLVSLFLEVSELVEGQSSVVPVQNLASVVASRAELLLDGRVIQTDPSLPFSYRITPPRLTPQARTFTLRVLGTRADGTPFASNLVTVSLLPGISLPTPADAQPDVPGLQVLERTPLLLSAFQQSIGPTINQADLLVNGVVVQTDANLPNSYLVTTPPFVPGAPPLTVQVQARTTDGLTLTSDLVVLTVIRETIPPRIQQIDPANGVVRFSDLREVVVTFSEPLDPATVTAANFRILGAGGNSVSLTGLTRRNNDNEVVLSFAALAAGSYEVRIRAAAVTDVSGNRLGAEDVVSQFTIEPFLGTFEWTNFSGGRWDDAANWNPRSVPGPNERARIQAGTATIITLAGEVVVGGLELASGTLAVTGRLTLNNGLDLLSAGRITGSGEVVVNGPFAFRGGNMTGTGRTRANGPITLGDDGASSVLDGWTLESAGTTTWNVANPNPFILAVHVENGAVWNNLPGSLFDARVDALFFGNDAGQEPGVFNNAGTLRKSAGTGTTSMDLSVINTGTVEVQVGTLQLETAVGESTTSTGAFTVAANATLAFAGEHTLTETSTVTGDGNVVLFGPTTINGLYDVRGGSRFAGLRIDVYAFDSTPADLGAAVTLSSGEVQIAGDYVQTASETLNVAVGRFGSHDFGGSLTATGQAQLAGTLNLSLVDGYTPSVGHSFTILSYGSRVGQFATVNGQDLGGGRQLAVSYNANDLTVTVVAGSPLRARGGPAAGSIGAPTLSPGNLALIRAASLNRWAAAGIPVDSLAVLHDVSIHIADLPGDLLGLATSDAIWLDHNAAGYGWFIDASPSDDVEFVTDAPSHSGTSSAGPLVDEIDLLTVLAHELGHVLGLDDLDPLAHVDDLMAGAVAPGIRHTPTPKHLDELLARGNW